MFAPLLTALLAAGTAHSDCGPDVKIQAHAPNESTGTMHYAQVLGVRIGTAKPLSLHTDLAQSELAPLPGPCFRLPGQRYLLLGWSSYGAGMETLHAWVLGVDGDAVAAVDRLTLTTDRPGAGLLVRHTGAGIAVGVPEPADSEMGTEEIKLQQLPLRPLTFEERYALASVHVSANTRWKLSPSTFSMVRAL